MLSCRGRGIRNRANLTSATVDGERQNERKADNVTTENIGSELIRGVRGCRTLRLKSVVYVSTGRLFVLHEAVP